MIKHYILVGIFLSAAIFTIECVAKQAKVDIPLINLYGTKENVELDELNMDNWHDVVTRKDYIIEEQKIKISYLEEEIEKWTIQSHGHYD